MITGADAIPLGTLLTARIFEVPKYQRAYAWEPDEVSDFVRDVTVLTTTHAAGGTPGPHFFGGLVSVDIQSGQVASGIKYEVVDGQQRLATFFLTVAATVRGLRRLADDAKNQGDNAIEAQAGGHAQTLERECLRHDVVTESGTVERLRLTLSRADDRFFNQLVADDANRNPEERASTRRLEAASSLITADLIDKALDEAGATLADRLNTLLRLRDCLLHHSHVIHVRSDNRREAYRLFSVLNDRGRSLSAGDLLRSHSLELLEDHPGVQATIEPDWDDMLQYEEAEVDQFLRSYFASHTARRASKTELWADVRDEFFAQGPAAVAAQQIRDRVGQMRTESGWLDKIRAGDWPYDSPTAASWDQSRVMRLTQTLRHDLCFPLLLAARAKLDEAAFVQIVLLLDRFVFRYISVVGASASKLNGKYIANARKIRTDTTWTVNELKQDLLQLQQSDASDEVFRIRLAEKLLYGVASQRQNLKYFLTTAQDYFASARAGTTPAQPDKLSTFHLDAITIEHIYPRSPQPGESDPQLDPLKDTLGNLTFWGPSDNQDAANESFAVKKQAPYYPNSAVQLTSELAGSPPWKQTPNWTLADLEARRDDLIEMAVRIFTAA